MLLYNTTSVHSIDFHTLSATAYNTTLALNDVVVISESIFMTCVFFIVVCAFVGVCCSKSLVVEVVGDDEDTILCSNVKTLKPI